jgi:prolyl-tRNA editing enzyme YbaK/EbsC (Cys-tRNA(Pro) deacylase)
MPLSRHDAETRLPTAIEVCGDVYVRRPGDPASHFEAGHGRVFVVSDADTPANDAAASGQRNAASDRVIEAAAATGTPYEIIPCDPDLADTAAFCDAYGYGLDQSANAIVVVGKSTPRVYAACLVLATTRLDVNGVVRKRLGTRKASFASGDETVEITGMQIGGVTPYGLPNELPLWIDAAVMACERVIVGGGSRDRKLLVPPASLAALPGADVVDQLAT